MRSEKEAIAGEFKERVADAAFVILADYRGLSVAKTEDLRRRLHEVEAGMQVVQNRLFGRVAGELNLDLAAGLKGPSAMIYGKGDVVAVAKALKGFIKENQLPVVKLGSLNGAVLSAADVEQLAGLPSRETLLTHVVCTIAAPMTQLVGVLQQKAASILYVLKAIQEKKEQA